MSNNMSDILDRAIYVAREYYPPRRTSCGVQAQQVFAVRYFDAYQEEVGYFLPDVGTWFGHIVPRIWSDGNLSTLNLVPVEELNQ